MEPLSEVMPYGLTLVGAKESVIAKDQPDYIPLPALIRHNGEAITCWEFSADEIEDVQKTKRIYLTQLTFGQKMQPILPQTETEFLAALGYQVADEVKSALQLFDTAQTFNSIEPGVCQKCGKMGGRVLSYQADNCRYSRWCCPFCSSADEVERNYFQSQATAFASALLVDFSYISHDDNWKELHSHRFGDVLDYVIDYLCEIGILEKHPEQNWYRVVKSPVEVLESFPTEQGYDRSKAVEFAGYVLYSGSHTFINNPYYKPFTEKAKQAAVYLHSLGLIEQHPTDESSWRYVGQTEGHAKNLKASTEETLQYLESVKALVKPIDMMLPCPRCGKQHVDAPELGTDWDNPPHKSHKCHGCGIIFRPADVPTNGVVAIQTRGEADTYQDAPWNPNPPTQQAWYWHWNGDQESAPIPTNVFYSGTDQKCFVTAGQLGHTRAINCDEYGGFWKPMITPALPPAE